MPSILRVLIGVSLIRMMCGCSINPGLAVVKPVSAHGTWTGTLVPITLYGKDYQEVDAVALRVEGGTALPSPKFVDTPPIGQEAIFVNQSWRVLGRNDFKTGERVEVTGLMKIDWVMDPGGHKVTHELNGPAWHYHAVHPEKIRLLREVASK